MVGVALAAWIAVGATVVGLRRWHIGDSPLPHSAHTQWTPRGAGFGLLIVLGVALMLTQVSSLMWVATLALPLGVVGGVDDIRDLSPWSRLGLQAATALAFLLTAVDVDAISPWLLAVSFVWLVGFVNSFNFMDGINGMSGVNSLALGGSWMLIATLHDATGILIVAAVLAGLALGFLPHNMPTARVFLGDSGSYLLGAMAAACAVLLAVRVDPVAALVPTGLYVGDTTWTILQRLRNGEDPFKRDRDYVFHRLVTHAGLSQTQATMLVGAGTLTLGLCAAWTSTTTGLLPHLALLVVAAGLITAYLRSPRTVLAFKRATASSAPIPATPRPVAEPQPVDA